MAGAQVELEHSLHFLVALLAVDGVLALWLWPLVKQRLLDLLVALLLLDLAALSFSWLFNVQQLQSQTFNHVLSVVYRLLTRPFWYFLFFLYLLNLLIFGDLISSASIFEIML